MSKCEPLTSELAVEVLTRTLEELRGAETAKRLEEARDNVGNEMLKMMQHLFPIVMQTQMEALRRAGLPEGRDGVVRFAQALRAIERDDPEVARLHASVKAHYLPAVSVGAVHDSLAATEEN